MKPIKPSHAFLCELNVLLSLRAEVDNETCYLRDISVKVEILILHHMSSVSELHMIKMLLPWLRILWVMN